MSFYNITLVVTTEQENAIIDLFRERCWFYIRIDKEQGPCVLPEYPEELIKHLQNKSQGTLVSDREAESSSGLEDTLPSVAANANALSWNYSACNEHVTCILG